MTGRPVHPSGGRVALAALGAAGAAAAPTILLGPLALFALPIGFIVAGVHVLLFGLPAYLLLRERRRIGWTAAILCGGLIGWLPLTSWSWLVTLPYGEGSWMFLSGGSLILAGLGMLGGLAFRAILGPPQQLLADQATAAVFE